MKMERKRAFSNQKSRPHAEDSFILNEEFKRGMDNIFTSPVFSKKNDESFSKITQTTQSYQKKRPMTSNA
jgi:hypothetical protein